MPPSFTITEQFAFGSQYSWRLKGSEVRFRGSGDYERLVLQRIPASDKQITSFFCALEMIQVWDWRDGYNPNDIGWEVSDGSSWTFSASYGVRCCRCGGENAYPSFVDPKQTTTDLGRFALLIAAMYDCFHIDGYIHQAKNLAKMSEQQSVRPERR